MIRSTTLEQDLRAYAKRRSKKLFNERLYAPISVIIDWIISKEYNNCNMTDKEDLKQLILIRITKDMRHYKPDKGSSAISFLRNMLISQELHKQKRRFERKLVEVEYQPNEDDRAEDHDQYAYTVAEMIETLEKYKQDAELTEDNKKVLQGLITLLRKDFKAWVMAKAVDKVQMIKDECHTTNQSIIDTLALVKAARLLKV